jgi:hypothetical protein
MSAEEMMAKHFNYYDDWRSAELECPACHWKGTFEQGSVEQHDAHMDCSCPKCDFFTAPMLSIVSYPTVAEMKASGDPEGLKQAERIEQFQSKFEARMLARKEQLPEIDAESFSLAWDFDEKDGERLTIIRHGDRVLYTELANWQGFEFRFEQVCKIVREKYGERVLDLVPTSASELYLYGDRVRAPKEVEEIRKKIFR